MKDDCTICSWVKDKFFSSNVQMSGRRKAEESVPIPKGFCADDIKLESSICTGERMIGFYDIETKHLKYAELVLSDEDINAFYRKYGLL